MHNFSFILVPVLPSYNNREEIYQRHLGRKCTIVPFHFFLTSANQLFFDSRRKTFDPLDAIECMDNVLSPKSNPMLAKILSSSLKQCRLQI